MKRLLSILGIMVIGLASLFCLTGCFGGAESAYDIAVRNGFEGTESQWLEYLKGKDGQDGENGVDYEDIRNLYDDLYRNGEYTGSFLTFIKDYIKVYDMGSTELVANHNLLSAVSVSAYYDYSGKSYYSSGAGVIFEIDEENNEVYFATNYHVVYVSELGQVSNEIAVNLYGMEYVSQQIECDYIGGSEAYDVAVLKVDGADAKTIIDGDYVPVEIAEYDNLAVGEDIIAIGNPQAEGITVVSGIVSADNKTSTYKISSISYKRRVFQIDAPINSGNSGGGVFNSDGQFIGIASSKHLSLDLDQNEIVEGMCYAIPAMNVEAIFNYVKNNYVSTPVVAKSYKFGISYTAANSTARYNTTTHETEIVEDIAISNVKENGLAEAIGLNANDLFKSIKITKPSGRIIEMAITRLHHVKDILIYLESGDNLEIVVKRNGEDKTLSYNFTVADNMYMQTHEYLAQL